MAEGQRQTKETSALNVITGEDAAWLPQQIPGSSRGGMNIGGEMGKMRRYVRRRSYQAGVSVIDFLAGIASGILQHTWSAIAFAASRPCGLAARGICRWWLRWTNRDSDQGHATGISRQPGACSRCQQSTADVSVRPNQQATSINNATLTGLPRHAWTREVDDAISCLVQMGMTRQHAVQRVKLIAPILGPSCQTAEIVQAVFKERPWPCA